MKLARIFNEAKYSMNKPTKPGFSLGKSSPKPWQQGNLMTRPVRTHPRLDPPRGPDRNQSETSRPNYSSGRRWVFSPKN